MEVTIAAGKATGDTGTLARLTDLAGLAPTVLGDRSESFSWFELLGITVFQLRGPQSAKHVGPVISCGALQRFPRANGFANSFLSLTIELYSLADHLLLHALLFLVTFSLLPGVVLGRLHQVVLCP
jgi:hypothetical protein